MTKSILVITLGKRDVQISKTALQSNGWTVPDFNGRENKKVKIEKERLSLFVDYIANKPDNFQIHETREGGKSIFEEIESFEPLLSLPIIEPLLSKLKNKGKLPDKILLIYTDQTDANFKGSDTVHFANIIQKKLQKDFDYAESAVDQFEVFEDLVNLDKQYDNFGNNDSINKLLWADFEGIDRIYLLAQGGIDQINQAITLKLIERFEHKVRPYQVTENGTVTRLDFATKFIDTLNKQKILKHLADYDFTPINAFFNSEEGTLRKHLTQFAENKLSLNYNYAKKNEVLIKQIDSTMPESLAFQENDFEKLKDQFITAKIAFHQRKYGECISKLYTVFENFFYIPLYENSKLEKKFTKNEKDEAFKEKIKGHENKLNQVEQQMWKNNKIVQANQQNKITTKHSRWGIYALFASMNAQMPFFYQNETNDTLEKLFYTSEALINQRNSLVHSLKPVKIDELNIIVSCTTHFREFKEVIEIISAVLEIEGFGMYDKIKTTIENEL